MLRLKIKKFKGGPFAITWMRFTSIRLVEPTEQKFRRFESVSKKKTNDCNSRAPLLTQRRSGASQHMTKTTIILICVYILF